MGNFTDDGYKRERIEDFDVKIKDGYRLIFGDNIDVSGDSQDGQIIAIMAEIFGLTDEDVEGIYKSFNPKESQGVSLSVLVTLNGLTRGKKKFSTVGISVTGTDGVARVKAGSIVKTSDLGDSFIVVNDITIAGGVGTGTAISEVSGAIPAIAGSLTIIDTPLTGWATVTNPSDADLGQDEESDEQLRIRRERSVSITARNTVDTIYGQLLATENVVAAKVLENVEDELDTETGIRAHGIRCIVQGGTEEDIVNVIFKNKTGGSPTDGSIEGSVINSQGQTIPILYDRPADSNIYIDLTITKDANYPADGDNLIKQEIINYFEIEDTALTIGGDVIYTEIWRPVYRVPGFTAASDGLKIGTSPSPTGVADIIIDFNGLARFDTSRILINGA